MHRTNYIWFFGKDQISGPEFGSILWDFNEKPFSPGTRSEGLEFDRNNASICDAEGNLLFYSNGCAVANRLHQVMPNGDSINAGEFFDLLWEGDCGNGYPGKQDITILTDPGNGNGYYLIHKPESFEIINGDVELITPELKYSYIDLSLDGGLGDVTEKNVTFAEGEFLWSYLTSIQHANGRDWWIINPDENKNIYYKFLLDDTGIAIRDTQEMGDFTFGVNTSASGTAKFSPDGELYCFFNRYDGMFLYDFDRETGELSNMRWFNTAGPTSLNFSSCEFSPDSRYLYLMESQYLYQVDTWADDLEASRLLIAEFNGVADPLPAGFFISTLGPDCRIYIRPGSSSNSFHVVNKPNERGAACDFVQQAIQLPFISATGSFPNFPRFRVDEEEKCDPTISTVVGETIYWRRDLTVYPNPVVTTVTLEVPESKYAGSIYVVDMEGQVLYERPVEAVMDFTLDLSGWPAGSYSVEFLPEENRERVVYTAMVVKVE